MSSFTKAIPNTRPDINRCQTMIKWPELLAMPLCAARYLPGPAPDTPHSDTALEATVADNIVAIHEGKISVKLSPSRRLAEAGNPAVHCGLSLVYSLDRGAGMPARSELSSQH